MSMTEVIINGRFCDQRVTGVQRYAAQTLKSLDRLVARGSGAFARWTLVVPRSCAAVPKLEAIRVERYGPLRGHAWEQLVLPWRVRDALLLSFGFTGPLAVRRQIVTVHDAAVVRFPQSYKPLFRAGYRLLVPRLVRGAPATMAVSRFSADEAVACFAADPARTVVGVEGWQHLLDVAADDAILDRHGLRGRDFVLAVSSPARNKNFAIVAKALATLGDAAPLCVVAGAVDPQVFRDHAPPDPACVKLLGYVSDAELRALYVHARCFVMPSLYEGFGIPTLEAMASGCPVIASTAAALREVGGTAALYFDPHDEHALARHIRHLVDDREAAAERRRQGWAQAQRYSWDTNARIHLEVLRGMFREPLARAAQGGADV